MKILDHTEAEHLYQSVYEKLSELLLSLQDFELATPSTADRVAITILEEDILALLEEAEEHFLSPHLHNRPLSRDAHSFVSRGETICEEATRLLTELSTQPRHLNSPGLSHNRSGAPPLGAIKQ